MDNAVSGQCACGAVTWSHPGPVTRSLLCHCETCRRAVSGAFSAVMGLEPQGLHIAGPVQEYASTPEASRAFCATCGTRLWFRSSRWPGEVFINVGLLEDPSDFCPDRHVVTDEAVCWAGQMDAVPRADGFDQTPQEVP